MAALNRKPDLEIAKSFELPDGTEIRVRRVRVKSVVQKASSKKMSDMERGLCVMASKLLVKLPGEPEFVPIVYDDLLDCFNDEELNFIAAQVLGEEDKDDKNKGDENKDEETNEKND